MRVADKMSFEQVNSNINKNRSQMSELQQQAATQKRVTKPSDDPMSASRVLSNRIDLQGNKQFLKNLNYAKSFIDFTDQSLGDLSENINRAKELAISQSNDASSSETSRQVVATEIKQLLDQMIQIGNRKLGDRYIFGGYKTTTQPFDQDGDYKGDQGEMLIHVEKGSFVPMNMPGSKIFLGDQPASGTSKSQIQPTSVEELKNQRAEKQKDKDAAEAAEFRGPAFDSRALSGSVSSEGSSSGSNLGTPATEDNPNGVNLFQAFKNLEVALRSNDKEGVQDTLEILDQAFQQVVMARSQVGSRSQGLENLMQSLEKSKVDNQIAISQHEDADVFATVSDMNKTESTLQATLQTSGKLVQPTLLQFLR